MGAPDILILISVSLVICVIRAFIPTTTAVVALIAPMLVGIAYITTLEFAPMLMVVAFWAATALLLVHTEPIYLITYKDGFVKNISSHLTVRAQAGTSKLAIGKLDNGEEIKILSEGTKKIDGYYWD